MISKLHNYPACDGAMARRWESARPQRKIRFEAEKQEEKKPDDDACSSRTRRIDNSQTTNEWTNGEKCVANLYAPENRGKNKKQKRERARLLRSVVILSASYALVGLDLWVFAIFFLFSLPRRMAQQTMVSLCMRVAAIVIIIIIFWLVTFPILFEFFSFYSFVSSTNERRKSCALCFRCSIFGTARAENYWENGSTLKSVRGHEVSELMSIANATAIHRLHDASYLFGACWCLVHPKHAILARSFRSWSHSS